MKIQVRLRGKWRTKAKPRVVSAAYRARFKVRVKRPKRKFLVRAVAPDGSTKVTRVRVAH